MVLPEKNKELEVISRKLDVIAGLLYDLKVALVGGESIRNKVAHLVNKDLSNKEIARILGISEKHVSKEKTLGKSKK